MIRQFHEEFLKLIKDFTFSNKPVYLLDVLE